MRNNKLKPKTIKNTKFFRFYFLDFILSRKANGFTLIEMMVSLGVFTVVVTMTLAALLNVMDMQKKTETFRKVNDNLNFAMEAMMREIREGKNYCPPLSGCASEIFSFTNKDGDAIKYEWDETGKYIKRTKGMNSLRMTSDGINITNLSFSVRGKLVGAGDNEQPLVIISISGESGEKEKIKSKLNLQTTVSQRELDLDL